MYTSLHDPDIVNKSYNEYLKLIKYYQGVKTKGLYVKYFNIDIFNSSYDDQLKNTYDRFTSSDIKYNLYDYTPIFYIQSLTNRTGSVDDLDGQRMDGASSVVIYSISRPKIDDLITFYAPINNEEIFRVAEITTPVNALHSKQELTWFQLELDYAPIKDISIIKTLNHFVYDISKQTYITFTEYKEFLNKLTNLTKLLIPLNSYYNQIKDYYFAENKIPLNTNELIIFIKRKYNNEYKRLFEEIKLPYGYFDKLQPIYQNKLENFPNYDETNNVFPLYDLIENKTIDYIWLNKTPPFENKIDELLYMTDLLFKECIHEVRRDKTIL